VKTYLLMYWAVAAHSAATGRSCFALPLRGAVSPHLLELSNRLA
jgi:hypothetical protein